MRRVAREIGAVAGCRPGVRDLGGTAIGADDDSPRVGDRSTAREHGARLEGFRHRTTQGPVGQVVVPPEPVSDGREHPTRTVDVLERHLELPSLAAAAVCLRSARHDGTEVGAPKSGREAERREDPRFGESRKRHPTHPLDNHRQEGEPRVRVRVVIAHRIVERSLRRDDLEEVLLCVHARAARPSGEGHEIAPLAQAAGV